MVSWFTKQKQGKLLMVDIGSQTIHANRLETFQERGSLNERNNY